MLNDMVNAVSVSFNTTCRLNKNFYFIFWNYLFLKASIQAQLKLGDIIPATVRNGEYNRYMGIWWFWT